MKRKEDWGDDVKPYDEHEDIQGENRGNDDWDDCEDDDREPGLDPGFSSWDDYYRYKFG